MPRQTGLKGWENGLQLNHFIPISKGGPDILENIRTIHGLCNLCKLNN
jgi:5-methylcytosine-specific restriction endonuclease McrA